MGKKGLATPLGCPDLFLTAGTMRFLEEGYSTPDISESVEEGSPLDRSTETINVDGCKVQVSHDVRQIFKVPKREKGSGPTRLRGAVGYAALIRIGKENLNKKQQHVSSKESSIIWEASSNTSRIKPLTGTE